MVNVSICQQINQKSDHESHCVQRNLNHESHLSIKSDFWWAADRINSSVFTSRLYSVKSTSVKTVVIIINMELSTYFRIKCNTYLLILAVLITQTKCRYDCEITVTKGFEYHFEFQCDQTACSYSSSSRYNFRFVDQMLSTRFHHADQIFISKWNCWQYLIIDSYHWYSQKRIHCL